MKNIGKELWKHAEPKTLKEFSEQLKITKITVEKNALLIEDLDYAKLLDIISKFGKFEIGKLRLKEFRDKETNEFVKNGVDAIEIKRVIDQNRQTKDEFNEMVDKLRISFKQQIKG